MKKRKLEADFTYDFSLLGIITAVKEYKLAWELNRFLEVDFVKSDDIQL